MNHYGIRGVTNNEFSSYLQNRSEYVSLNGFISKFEHIHCGVPQGSILGPLLFLIYINDLNCAIKYFSVHHFPADTDLLNYNNSVKRMNKQVNQDLKNPADWLNANKICPNVTKTEVVIFKSSRKLTDVPLKLKLNVKRLYPTNSVKYLGVNIDENLNWIEQVSDIAIKLNGILSKLSHFIDCKTVKSIYHAIFEPHLHSSSLVWAKNSNSIKRLFVLQKKSLPIISLLNLLYSENLTS